MTDLTRRALLRFALPVLAAPAIVRVSSLMRLSPWKALDAKSYVKLWGDCRFYPTGLVYYDLMLPAKNLFPVITPLIPRKVP